MKYTFIFPPMLLDFSPIIGIPDLLGVLKKNGIKTSAIDLNAEFVNYIFDYKSKDFFLSFFKANNFNYKFFIENIEKIYFKLQISKKILKDKKLFYNPFLCKWAVDEISRIFDIFFSFSCKIEEKELFTDPNHSIENIDCKELLQYILSHRNIYKHFISQRILSFDFQERDIIGISINSREQFVPAITLAYLLKKNFNVHINIGGTFFTTNYLKFSNLNQYFDIFFDSISVGDSEKTTCELAFAILNKKNLSCVSNLILPFNNSYSLKTVNYEKLFEPDICSSFEGYDKELYLLPEFVIPIVASKSCYWAKCKFCNCSLGKIEDYKNPESLVSEIQLLSKNYNSNYFLFWDNSLPPSYLKRVSHLLLDKNIDINYSLYLRLEKAFDNKLLSELNKSGLRKVNWGLDSGSSRILEYIDKGVNLDSARKVLYYSRKNNIQNFVHIILGFPTEKREDILNSISFLKNNKKNISIPVISESMYFTNGSIFEKEKKELQKLIETSREERKAYTTQIYKIFNNKQTLPWYYYSQISLLYFSKYKRGRIIFYDFLINFFFSNLKIKKILLNLLFKIFIKE